MDVLQKVEMKGTRGKVVRFMVAISYEKGAICCKPDERLCGHFFAAFIKMNFKRLFMNADKGTNRLWNQDGNPSQNSGIARSAMHYTNSTLIKVPPRSPDLNNIALRIYFQMSEKFSKKHSRGG